VSVRIGGGQLMMHILGGRKRRQYQKENNQAERQAPGKPRQDERDSHRIRIEYHKAADAVKRPPRARIFIA
jgi:hypothetical protein